MRQIGKNAAAPTSKAKELQSRPLCATCNKPVDSFTEEEATFTPRVTFTARCHGAIQKIDMDREMMEKAREISFGVAFQPEHRIDAPRVRGLLGPGKGSE